MLNCRRSADFQIKLHLCVRRVVCSRFLGIYNFCFIVYSFPKLVPLLLFLSALHREKPHDFSSRAYQLLQLFMHQIDIKMTSVTVLLPIYCKKEFETDTLANLNLGFLLFFGSFF